MTKRDKRYIVWCHDYKDITKRIVVAPTHRTAVWKFLDACLLSDDTTPRDWIVLNKAVGENETVVYRVRIDRNAAAVANGAKGRKAMKRRFTRCRNIGHALEVQHGSHELGSHRCEAR